jgi:hypothetical protein
MPTRTGGFKLRSRLKKKKVRDKISKAPPAGHRLTLAQLFLKKMRPAVEGLVDKASANVLEHALVQPDPIGSIADLISGLAATGSHVSSDPLLEAIARGTVLKKDLLKRAGGTWNVNQVAKALEITRQAVDKRRDRGALLAVPSGQGDFLYPRCQFTEDGVIPELNTVLRSFRVRNPWTQLSALLAPAATLDGEQVLKALKKGNVEGAVSAVSSIGDTLDDAAPEV